MIRRKAQASRAATLTALLALACSQNDPASPPAPGAASVDTLATPTGPAVPSGPQPSVAPSGTTPTTVVPGPPGSAVVSPTATEPSASSTPTPPTAPQPTGSAEVSPATPSTVAPSEPSTSSPTPVMPTGVRGPTPPSATSQFPFPQNRSNGNCVSPTAYTNEQVKALYDAWKKDLVTADGAGGFRRVARVAEHGLEAMSTVSEGIGYGMLIAVYMDDQALFDDLWKYALKYAWTSTGLFMQTGEQTLLMNWYIHADGNVSPGQGDDPAGNGAASDADEDMAFALVMADKQWGGQGSLDRPYLDYAHEMIDDIWKFEVADERLIKNGSSWGDDSNLNISYFAPAYYRVFEKVTGDARWTSGVVPYSYTVIENSLNSSNGNQDNGLVPAWSTSAGAAVTPGPGENPQPFNYQYDSCRTPFRIGVDACWNGEARAKTYLAKVSSFFSAIGAGKIVDGYELNGTPKPEFPDSFGGLSGAFIGPASVGAMHDPQFQGFVDEAYTLLIQNSAWAGGQYYDESWIMMAALMLSDNFLDYTEYE